MLNRKDLFRRLKDAKDSSDNKLHSLVVSLEDRVDDYRMHSAS